MAEPTIAEKAEQFRAIGSEFYAGVVEGIIKSDTSKAIATSIAEIVKIVLSSMFVLASPIGTGLGRGMSQAEDLIAPAFAGFAADGVNDVFGTNLSESVFSKPSGTSARRDAGDALGRALMAQLRGTEGALGPSDVAASKFVSTMAGMAIEDWFKGWFFEVLSSLVPQLDIGKIEKYGGLGDKVANVLGINGVARRVLRPLVDTTIVTPLEWKTNATYRPRLLSPGEVARQMARGQWTRERGFEELARQGYSDQRIEALLNAQRKFLSPSDVRTLQYYDYWTGTQPITHLRDQGYDEQTAVDALRLEGLKRNAQFEDAAAATLIGAYAARDIDDASFNGLLTSSVTNTKERRFAQLLGQLRREVNIRRISVSQVEAAVKAKILNVVDYRRALEREGYPDDDVIVLELLLRYELDREADREAQRVALLAERAREKAARELERQRRAAQLAEQRTEDRRGPIAALEQAAVRGLIPLERAAEVYSFDYDADAVAILVSLLEGRRADYVAGQERRAAAEQRAARRGLSVGQYRAAVLAGALSLAEYRGVLEHMELPAADVDILVATLDADVTARAAAVALRREAAAAAQRRRIDLGRFERLVRRGARTLEQYGALLADLGYDEGSIAAMRQLLELTIADDAAARDAREAADAKQRDHGPTVTQFMRGVVLGVKTADEYEAFLRTEGFSADAQILLMAELRAELADAEAARARREQEATVRGDRQTSLSTVRRAAQLGLISPDAYYARLLADGYGADDADLELELLLFEIGEVQDQRAERDAADAAARARGLTLAQLERAVKTGVASVDVYRARVAEIGYAPDAAAVLVQLLERELSTLADARRRRDQIEADMVTRDLSLAQLEDAVKKGFRSLDEYYAEVVGLGYGTDDAELLTNLLAVDIETAAESP